LVCFYEDLPWPAQDDDWSTKGKTLQNVTVFHVESGAMVLEFLNLPNCVIQIEEYFSSNLE